ncbi:hypothetical protein D0S45_21035, partial [Marinifilum sp. JC120]
IHDAVWYRLVSLRLGRSVSSWRFKEKLARISAPPFTLQAHAFPTTLLILFSHMALKLII